MDNLSIIFVEEIIIGLLLIAAVVAIAARHLRLPYTVGLVLIGLTLAWLVEPQERILSSQIILALLVPPLVFEAAFHIRFDDLRRDFWLILLLAVPGVILTTLMVGGLVAWGTGLAVQMAMVFGALISATDPVAVVALFRRLGAPKRLQVLLEGESLFNDGTAIVMFQLMVNVAIAGRFQLAASVGQFLAVSGGGVLIGIILGMVVSQIISRVDDPLVETTLTTVLAFGAYLVAEAFHVSGVLAVVAAGVVNGNVGPQGMSPTTRVVVFNFWEYAAFLANSLIFLLIGLTIDQSALVENWLAILWAILAVLVARGVSVYVFLLFNRSIPWKWRHVLYWGGLRGAIALALALTLTDQAFAPEVTRRLQAMAFGVVLFTLLVQGISMDWLVRRLKLIQRTRQQDEYERRHARFVAGRAAYNYLQRMSQQGLISEHTWQRLGALLERQNDALVEAVRETITSDPTVEIEELDTARRETLRAQRNALTGLLRDGVISEETHAQLVGEVDAALTESHLAWTDRLRPGKPVNRLLAAVVQEKDLENAIKALRRVSLSVSQMPGRGGFLGRQNIVLLVGLPDGREALAVEILQQACHRRVTFTASPFKRFAFPFPAPTRVTIGGATIFVFDVEEYHEF